MKREERALFEPPLLFLVVFSLSVLSFCSAASAEELRPMVCSGYNFGNDSWEHTGEVPDRVFEDHCPKDFALLRVEWMTGANRGAPYLPIRGVCCPLPKGILTEEHSYVSEHCPEESVATGARTDEENAAFGNGPGDRWENSVHLMRCTKINTKRFRLGPPAKTLRLGFQADFDHWFYSSTFTSMGRIPIALRYGLSREGRYTFSTGGCIGYPWGSLLTGKMHKYCGLEFRSLEYAGQAGDPPAGTPVKLYPDCISLDDPLSPAPRCLPRDQ